MGSTYLVDVNIWSEAVKPSPNSSVMKWMETHQNKLVMNAIVLGEIQAGVFKLEDGKKRRALEQWVETLVTWFLVWTGIGRRLWSGGS